MAVNLASHLFQMMALVLEKFILKQKRILVVEDNASIAESLCELLEMNGYQTCPVAKSYEEAVSHFKTYAPDLVTLDIKIEGEQTGIDVAKYIRENSDIPFIYLSGSIDKASISLVNDTRPFAFFVKPYEFVSLENTLQTALNRKAPAKKLCSSI
ncbi:response regulator [Roseivirga echinicomitans]